MNRLLEAPTLSIRKYVVFSNTPLWISEFFFFLKRGQKLCHDRLIKKEFTRMFTQRKPPVPKSYSPGISEFE
jgi:hypothetical protein